MRACVRSYQHLEEIVAVKIYVARQLMLNAEDEDEGGDEGGDEQ